METIDVDVEVVKVSDHAVLVKDLDGDGDEVWVAKSQIAGALPDVGEEGTIEVAAFVARENGWY